jgi:cysteine-rich repeat protein
MMRPLHSLLLALAIFFVATPRASAVETRDLQRCQSAVEREGAKLQKVRTVALSRCVDRLLECTLGSEIDAVSPATCQAAALAACTRGFSRASTAATKFDTKAAGACDVPDSDLRSRRGLGFRDAADACAALTPPGSTATTAAALACARRTAACAADDQVEQSQPRAFELLDAAGLAASAPCIDARPPASPTAATSSTASLLYCQRVVANESAKVDRTQARSIRACAGALLRCDLPADRLERTLTERDACRAAALAPKCASTRARLLKHETTRTTRVLAACGAATIADVKARLGFAAVCPTATTLADVNACLATDLAARGQHAIGVLTPRSCALLRTNGQLTGYEGVCVPACGNGRVEGSEVCDDGNADTADRCTNACTTGPTDLETLLIPSTAHPAGTPDGTLGTAVAPGSTLATQFGSTTFDLNRASYTRYFVPGAGAPDAVLVLVPGFAGGAGSFRALAENILLRAASTTIQPEIWVYERRSNQLEDTAGADIAENDLDGILALDWFFGGSIGLPLDARLTRRAVFHSGPDVAFMANWTPAVFARDIDAVVEIARALPGSPAVFLGGHSLGTTFTGRYAATDLDVGAPVVPGFSKLAGLVLLEGGAGAVPATPPTSADLDRVIAKADGGLFHAVADGAARCVDGTPCTTDADCAGAPLPAGAVGNACIAPTDAYTGATAGPVAFINPLIQAAGHTIGIQGILDTDGLAAIQMDFGSGPAVDTVGGLGILNALPPSSVAAGLGFFLDDDFSPVAAFRASLGFSNNGPNNALLGLVVPGAAFSDPYRVWIDIDQTQPIQALPNNGAPTATLSKVWGQEKEITSLPRFLPALFAGATDFGDWYFPSAGLSTTVELTPAGAFGGLDSTPLSIGRGRPDIENLTQIANVDIPVISFGGSNGLTPTAASFRAFANSIGTCSAPSCTGATPRLVTDNPITPTYGGIAGGFEVYINEGYAHVDVVTADDDPLHNQVVTPLVAFLERNTP